MGGLVLLPVMVVTYVLIDKLGMVAAAKWLLGAGAVFSLIGYLLLFAFTQEPLRLALALVIVIGISLIVFGAMVAMVQLAFGRRR